MVTASGPPPLNYQWYNGTGSILGATNSTLHLLNVQTGDSGTYYVAVSNPYGSTNSSNAILTVTNQAPIIISQPVNQSVPPGGTATFRSEEHTSELQSH